MIISASYRTDIPAFYGAWFINRFRAGSAMVANPYGGKPSRVALRTGIGGALIDGYVFWTRNIGPFVPALDEVRRADLSFVIQYTITAYPKPLEPAVIDARRSIALIRLVARAHGPRTVVWRYDPILVTDLTPIDWHLTNFAMLAGHLEGAVDEVVISFAQLYRKAVRNLTVAGRDNGFGWCDPDRTQKQDLAQRLAAIARAHGMVLSLCTQPDLIAHGPGMDGPVPARCIDAVRLSDTAGRPIAARTKGNRPGCLCAESRDIGDYDCCPHGCVYCYAVTSRPMAKRRFQAHDPAGDYLVRRAETAAPAAVGP